MRRSHYKRTKKQAIGRRGNMRGRGRGKHMCGEGKNVLATTAPSKTTTTMGVRNNEKNSDPL